MTDSVLMRGRVVAGQGRGAGFTGLPWVRAALVGVQGIDPFPGTLNLRLARAADLWTWAQVRKGPGIRLTAPGPDQCDARCYPVRLAGRVPGAIVLPEVPGYPPDQLEIIAPVALRSTLGLVDGAEIPVEVQAPPRLQALVFDVDGTLVDSLEGYRLAAARAAEPLGLTITGQAVRDALNRNTPFWDLVLEDHPDRSPDLVARLRAATLSHWPEVLATHVNCFPGVDATLATLRGRGYRLGIFTGSRGESFGALERAGLLARFDVVLTAADVPRNKPHPDGLLRCVERLAVEPKSAAYVGDTMLDMAAGRAAGMLAIGVLSGAASSAELAEAGAHWLVSGQAGLPDLLAPAAA